MTATLIPAADRHFWANEWLTSRQSFPGTGNFDLFGNAHGVLAIHNDDEVGPGEGLDAHQHQNMEIVTWVVDGAVEHRDSSGIREVIGTGSLGAMTAGRGITHSEGNAQARSSRQKLRVIQMWVPPHTDELDPAHSTRDFNDALASGEPVVVASGRAAHAGTDALPIANRFAALHIARPHAGQTITLPAAPFGHLYVVRGEVVVDADSLASTAMADGDAVRLTDGGAVTLTATGDAEIVYWEMHASFDVPRPA
ncbi:pirin family protein [Gordonia sp. (in: high G+C Gram-positive bacteria)]|uniref:pirin family protein n=1 Tax=Gordonia sp. (in: high G+C Gram-positive bacteria) TaxID=84139 RepID=UPI0016A9FA96|nr:pirin family protein [Gordonia sp. (in: high G+C Gram-positive bacteria)]NLG48189.1 pirin family protein [Gordonia sp. (in: high G+C Gram-positive bacteria)]